MNAKYEEGEQSRVSHASLFIISIWISSCLIRELVQAGTSRRHQLGFLSQSGRAVGSPDSVPLDVFYC